ncbi:MAG: hypothetical protein JXR94_11225 [Candidatus Hydrogenedentes bacterium]|nr:hypothetical protein [Candidatus Hydrogenedentota bacterium]
MRTHRRLPSGLRAAHPCTWIAFAAFAVLGLVPAHAAQSPESPVASPGVSGVVRQVVDGAVQPSTPAGGAGSATVGAAPADAEAGGTGVHAIRRQALQSRVTLPGSTFEPALQHEIPAADVPDVGELITVSPDEGPIPVTRLLDDLAMATGWSIVASEGVEQRHIRFWLKEVKPKQALEVLKFNGIHYEFDPNTNFLYVMLAEEYLSRTFGAIQEQEFAVKHADVIDMEAILRSLMSQNGRMIADPRTGHIMVWDTAANLDAMREAVARLDVPLEPRVFNLKFLDAETLLESVQSVLSERGLAHVDPRTNTLVVSDLPARQDQIGIMVTALDRKLETRTWTLNYAQVDVVEERLQTIIPEDTVSLNTDEDAHQVSVTATPERLDEIDEIIRSWDVKGRQVMIEAFLVSAKTTVKRELGIDWSYFDEISGVPFALQSGSATPDYTAVPGEGQRMTVGRLPYRQFLRDPWTGSRYMFLDDDDGNEAAAEPTGDDVEYVLDPEFKGNRVAFVLNYLDQKGAIDILSRPRVTVHDGQEAIFENTTDIPYQEGGYSQYTSTTTDNVNFNRVIPLQVQFVTVGTILTVEPRINGEDNIRLVVEAEDSTADIVTVTVGDQESTVPQKTENKATTEVLVHNGQTIVIGGLHFTSVDDDTDRVPLLGDLPFVGRLFRTTEKFNEDRELLVFITSTIVDEYTHPEAERLADADEAVTDSLRHSQKGIFGRAKDRMTGGKGEIAVSIGHTGIMHCDGDVVTLDDLRQAFSECNEALDTKVIIRSHPRAPDHLGQEIADAAREAGLKVEFDNARMPVVPDYRQDYDD